MTTEPEVTPEAIADCLVSLSNRLNEELFALTADELADNWHWQWDVSKSMETNTYQFFYHLELHERRCRRWEEHHNGSACVVGRVRDKYLMPRISEFLVEIDCRLSAG